MKQKISAKIIADSITPQGHRIITYILTYPRFIHGELMTHRVFSRNSASSRAIPFKKMSALVEDDPFIPIAWQKDHKGMQGTEYWTDELNVEAKRGEWLIAKRHAINQATQLNNMGVTKQLCNRLLEPFQWHTVLVTATEYDGFFELRCPKLYHAATGKYYKSVKDWNNIDKDIQYEGLTCLHPENTSQAEIHIQALAESMWDAMNESTPKELKAGEWHIPFGNRIDLSHSSFDKFKYEERGLTENEMNLLKVKVSTARCARLSYMTFDGEIAYEKDLKLHDTLLESQHMSPFEHCARAMSDKEYYSFIKGVVPTQIDKYGITNLEMMPYSTGIEPMGFTGLNSANGDKYGWCTNFKGFIPYRYLIESKK